MPTFEKVREAAKVMAVSLSPRVTPSEFYGTIVPEMVLHPDSWGCSEARYYAGRPNWDARNLGEAIAEAIWGRPFHPQAEPARRWAGLPYRILRRLCSGDSVQQVLGAWDMSPRECGELLDAAAWNRRGGATEWEGWLAHPLTWVVRHCTVGAYVPRSRAIADWLVAKKVWSGWRTPVEVGYGPDGTMQLAEPRNLLDEVQNEDLVQGAKTNPERVIRAVIARTSAETLRWLAEQTTPFPALPWTLIPGVRHVVTPRELLDEGKRMDNCAAGYADRCCAGDCYILSLVNSTVEVLPDGTIYQHRGPHNADPCESDRALLARWANGRKKI